MDKKYSMFPSGKIISIDGGIPKTASKAEQASYLASLLPKEHKGKKIAQVMYNPKDGCVYGKTASTTIKKKIFAQQTTNKQEPVDGTQKQKETKVPRNESKAKPETSKVTKDRPDVGNPDEVRNKEYKRGTGGENLHSDKVPRDKSGDGVGGKKVKFEKENADDSTSGKPDSYVQDFQKSEKPASAGSEANHTAGSEITFNSDQSIYHNLKLSGKEEKGVCDGTGKEEGGRGINCKDKKDKKKGKLPPWLKNKDSKEDKDKDEDEKSSDKEANLKYQLKKANDELATKEKEITSMKLKSGRVKEAIVYALSMLKLNPKKYSNPETFTDFIESTASNLSLDAIKTASEESKILLAEKQKLDEDIVKQASVSGKSSLDGGLSTVINTINPDEDRFEKTASTKDKLKDILMSGSILGRQLAEYDDYVQSEPVKKEKKNFFS